MKREIPVPFVALAMLLACGESQDESVNQTKVIAESTVLGGSDGVSTAAPHKSVSHNNPAGDPEYDQDMAYHFSQGEHGATLRFGVPQTDNIALNLRCPPGANEKGVLIYFTRPERIVAKRPATISMKAGKAEQQVTVETRTTELGTTVEVAANVDGPVLQYFRTGRPLDVVYGEEAVTIPSRSSDQEIQQFFDMCMA